MSRVLRVLGRTTQKHISDRALLVDGGNRRKLSVAAALVGLPRVVFLDEPTAGVDVLARRDILEALRTISNACGTAIIITSHMMEECESACDRVGIMADGQFRCLGPLRRIKERYGRGCTIVLNAADDHRLPPESIDSVVQEILPRSKRLRSFKGKYEYRLDKSMSWGAILSKLELLKTSLGVEDIWLSPMTLEDIFSDFAALDRQAGSEGS